MITPVDLTILERDFAQLERLGSPYNYGGKAPTSWKGTPIKLKDVTPQMIVSRGGVDCSGYVRWALGRATGGNMIIPDGSQIQREWAEKHLRKVKYSDAARYMTDSRLFIAFIKPFTNGCGSVGHVWLLAQYDDGNNGTKAGTLESHGGGGCVSRPWNYRTLIREVYSCFELPAT